MKKVKILINSIDKVKRFVSIANKFTTTMDIASGRYIIDAKSIMGIFSMDLNRPMELIIHSKDEKEINIILAELKEFISK